MKKVYTVLSCLFLLILLVAGITSIFTLDSSATKPGLTFVGLLDGSYTVSYTHLTLPTKA